MENKKPLDSVISAGIDQQVHKLVDRLGVELKPGTWYECVPLSYVDKYATWGGLPIILEAYFYSIAPRKLGAVYIYLCIDGDDSNVYRLYTVHKDGRMVGASFWMDM